MEIDLLDVHQSKQFLDRPRHLAAALVTRAAALSNADLRPELLLVHAQAPPDFTGVQDAVQNLHECSAARRCCVYRRRITEDARCCEHILYQWHIFCQNVRLRK